jgi:hypothetical protein
MGSMLWAVDQLLNNMIRPMFNAYQFKDYESAANILQQLNEFLVGYGEGIDDLPKFDNVAVDVRDRMSPQLYYKQYYEMYSRDVLKQMGIYVRKVLDKVKLQNLYPVTASY